jgi:hypothetical protein
MLFLVKASVAFSYLSFKPNIASWNSQNLPYSLAQYAPSVGNNDGDFSSSTKKSYCNQIFLISLLFKNSEIVLK